MIIESLVGLVLMISGGGEKSVDPTSAVIKGINQANKVIERKKIEEFNNTNIENEIKKLEEQE